MGHWLADVHSGSFAPAFTLSFHDSERSRKPPMPIASVVSGKATKKCSTTINKKINNSRTNNNFNHFINGNI